MSEDPIAALRAENAALKSRLTKLPPRSALEARRDLFASLVAGDTFEACLEAALGVVCRALDMDLAALVEQVDGRSELRGHFSEVSGLSHPVRAPIEETMCPAVEAAGGVLSANDLGAEIWAELPIPKALGFGAFVGRHVRVGGCVYGTLGLARRSPRAPFASHEDDLLNILLRWLTSQLERRLADRRSRELSLRLEAAQRLDGLGLLASGIAHDFNNLLTGVLTNAAFLFENLDDRELREAASDILAAGENGAALADQLLSYAGRRRADPEVVDLAEVCRSTRAVLSPSLPPGVGLSMDLGEGCVLQGEPTRLRQVVVNLVLNGAQAMARPGEVHLSTRRAPASPLGDAVEGPVVVLEVVDRGSGMDSETRSRIFDPFFTTKPEGRGLGLAAVLGIIKQHEGLLDVRSTPGKGSTFTVVLPAVSTPVQVESDSGPLPWRSTGLVLVVDDDKGVRASLRRVLDKLGFEVQTARSGQEALEAIEARRPRLVLLDLVMPGMDGATTLGHIRDRWPGLCVAMMSGYSEEEVSCRMNLMLADGFVQKPFTPKTLGRAIRDIMSHAEG